MSQRHRLFVGPMTGIVYSSAHYERITTDGEEILKTKTKHDVTPDFVECLRWMAAGAMNPSNVCGEDRYVVLVEGHARILHAAAATLLTHIERLAEGKTDTTTPMIREATEYLSKALLALKPKEPDVVDPD